MSDAAQHSSLSFALSAKALRTKEQPISFLINEAMRNPRLINLAAGLVDPLTLPVAECAAITRKIFADEQRGRAALQYDTTVGLAALRQATLRHIEQLEGISAAEMGISADDIVLTTGSQQALYLIGDALIDPGDIVIAANPSYFVYQGALSSLGAVVAPVPIDENGMDVDAVARTLERIEREGKLDRVKAVYCTSYYQNPTGLTLSAERRPRLLEIVKRFSRRHRILILEDAAYRELSYDGAAHRSIKSYDTENRFTAISHTFSKPFAPGIKLGYSTMPPDLMHAVLQQKGNHDFGSSSLTQHMALEAFRDGSYHAHVRVLERAYRAKRDAMLAALARALGSDGVESDGGMAASRDARPPSAAPASLHRSAGPSRLHWTHPHGGLYVWLTLPVGIDTSRGGDFFRACVDEGVLYVPGAYCFQPDAEGHVPTNHIRLSFGQVAPDQIEPGIQRLANVIRRFLKPQSNVQNPQSLAGAV